MAKLPSFIKTKRCYIEDKSLICEIVLDSDMANLMRKIAVFIQKNGKDFDRVINRFGDEGCSELIRFFDMCLVSAFLKKESS